LIGQKLLTEELFREKGKFDYAVFGQGIVIESLGFRN
jgi:hypothetical protein